MKYYIIAGEASGDLHGSNLIKEIKKIDFKAEFRCWGGNKMQHEGAIIVKNYADLAFMGFVEVALNLNKILANFKFCKKDIKSFNPDCIILIDYPGFNLKVAKLLKSSKIPIFYYISPQLWAWNKSRIKTIKKYIDRMIVILPFEKDFYKNYNFDVKYVGHPLLDEINIDSKIANNVSENNNKIVAILPGSRKQEIKNVLPTILKIVNYYSNITFKIAAVNSIEQQFYIDIMGKANVKLELTPIKLLLKEAYAAIVTSGTATLETALYNVPQIVCYKGKYLSYLIAKQLIKIKFISLVNIIMNKLVVVELIQKDMNNKNIKNELDKLLFDMKYRDKIQSNYNVLKALLGGKGASERAAQFIINEINLIKNDII